MELQEKISQDAQQFAFDFNGGLDIPLNFTLESLIVIDQFLESVQELVENQETFQGMVATVGNYILEVTRRAYGGEYYWEEEYNQPILVTDHPDYHVAILGWEKVKLRVTEGTKHNIPFHIQGYDENLKRASSEKGLNVLLL